jgi:hypothetical protein
LTRKRERTRKKYVDVCGRIHGLSSKYLAVGKRREFHGGKQRVFLGMWELHHANVRGLTALGRQQRHDAAHMILVPMRNCNLRERRKRLRGKKKKKRKN